MIHVVLLGDSIFDNARYVPGGPSIVEQLRARLPRGGRATLLARDGAGTAEIVRQLATLPDDATHVILSVGGNDALDHSTLLRDEEEPGTAVGLLTRLAAAQTEFQQNYRESLRSILATGLQTAVCTVYDSIPGLQPRERAGLALFNEVILREAFSADLPVIDLRLVCTERDDYSSISPIEPSVSGGRKITRAIGNLLAAEGLVSGKSRIFRQ